MNAFERAQQLMTVKGSELPPVALDYRNHLCRRIGMCMEACLSAFVTYAQVVEELTMEGVDELYIAPPSEIEVIKKLHREYNALMGYVEPKPLPPPWEREKLDESVGRQGKS